MCLSTAGSAIGKNGRIVSIQNTVEEALGGCLVNVALGRILIKNLVEAVCLILDAFATHPCPGESRDWRILGGVEYPVRG